MSLFGIGCILFGIQLTIVAAGFTLRWIERRLAELVAILKERR